MKKIWLLAGTDLKLFLTSPKALLILILTVFFSYDFVQYVMAYSEGLSVGVAPYVYPVFMEDWTGNFMVVLLVCVLMSDAPFPNGSERNIRMFAGKYVWLAGKILYILLVSAIFQAVLVLTTYLVFFPNVGISGDWGYVLKTYYVQKNGTMDASGIVESGYLLSYTPQAAMALEFFLATAVSTMLGMAIFILNCVFKNYTGTILISILSCTHLILEQFGFYAMAAFDPGVVPTSWMSLGGLTENLAPGIALAILAVIIGIFTAAAAGLLKMNRIEV